MSDNVKNKELASFEDYCNWLYSERLCSLFPRVNKESLQKNGVIVYGIAIVGKIFVSQLVKLGIKPDWIVDRDTELHGTDYMGINIRPLSSFSEAGERFIMLASTHIREMANVCVALGAKKWIFPAAIRDWCPLLGDFGICNDGERNIAELKNAFTLMADEKSREIFRRFIRWHHTFDNDFSMLNDHIPYFPDDLQKQIDYSFFIDAGAFNGDTLNDWLQVFNPASAVKESKYHAFEPTPNTFDALNAVVAALPDSVRHLVQTYNMAVGNEKNGFIEIDIAEDISSVQCQGTGVQIPCKRIDDLFASACPTIIKADIEGAEMELLRGAEETIRRCRPVLAIAVYHKYSDLWTIPMWIHELDCGYEIYLRHSPKVFTDTVCYAIPPGNKQQKD